MVIILSNECKMNNYEYISLHNNLSHINYTVATLTNNNKTFSKYFHKSTPIGKNRSSLYLKEYYEIFFIFTLEQIIVLNKYCT